MEQHSIEGVVQDVNKRLTRVEQILPTLATKAALAEAVAPLATKAELLATRADLEAVRVEMRDEGRQTRWHFDVVAERLEDQIRLVAEGQVILQERMDTRFEHLTVQIAGLDRRVMRLEAGRGR